MEIKLKTLRKLVSESILREEATSLAQAAAQDPAKAVASLSGKLVHVFQSSVPGSQAKQEQQETRHGQTVYTIMAPGTAETDQIVAAVKKMSALLSGFKDDTSSPAMGGSPLSINKYLDLGTKGMSLDVQFAKVATGMQVQKTSDHSRRQGDGAAPEEARPTKWRLEVFARRPAMYDD